MATTRARLASGAACAALVAVLTGLLQAQSRAPPPPVVPSGQAYRYEGDELKAFAGEYYSDELESTYRVAIDEGHLRLRRGVQRQAYTLVARGKDEFDLPGSVIRFRRGPDGAVIGLVVDADRTRGLAFERR